MNWRRYYTGTRSDLQPEDRFYHGTRAILQPGDLIQPGYVANFGKADRVSNHVYFSATLDAGVWGADRSRAALLVIGECADWQGHPPEVLQAMKDHLARLKEQGLEQIDD